MEDIKNKITVSLIKYRQLCDDNNICDDDMETELLELLSVAGFEFNR